MKKIILILLIFICLSSMVNAIFVERTLDKKGIMPREELTIKLKVTIDDGTSFYAIDEIIPDDFEIVDDGGSASQQSNHLMWYSLDSTKEPNSYSLPDGTFFIPYKYVIRTKWQYPTNPEQAKGEYYFNGTYMAQSMQEEQKIIGDDIIKVFYCVRADRNCNGCVNMTELVMDIEEWITGKLSLRQIIETIGLWRQGCYKGGCEHECELGEIKCVVAAVSDCIVNDDDCKRWSHELHECSLGYYCVNGECIPINRTI